MTMTHRQPEKCCSTTEPSVQDGSALDSARRKDYLLRLLCHAYDCPEPPSVVTSQEEVFALIEERDPTFGPENLQDSLWDLESAVEQVTATVLDIRELCEVRPGLFLGSAYWTQHADILRKRGITHVLDCAGVGLLEGEGFEYLNLDLDDVPEQSLTAARETALPFIRNALASGGRVFVHCYLGVSRSPSMVMAYLMETEQLTAREAFFAVSSRRPAAHPNPGFLEQLGYETEP